MVADYSFCVKTIETHARAFLTHIILAIGKGLFGVMTNSSVSSDKNVPLVCMDLRAYLEA